MMGIIVYIDNIIMNRFYYTSSDTSKCTVIEYVKARPDQFILILLIVILILTLLFILNCNKNYKRKTQISILEKQRYEQISELSNEFFFEYNIRKDCLRLPEKSANFLGCQKETYYLKKGVLEHLRQTSEQEIDFFSYIVQAQEGTKEILFCLPNQNLHWLRIVSKVLFNTKEEPVLYIGKLVDIHEEKEQHYALLEKAKRDSLTQLYNTATFHELITDYLNTCESALTGTLFIIDIDHFKDINDTYGHYTGDYILTEFAKILAASFRKDDIIGRLGGDEFIIFIKQIVDPAILDEKCRLLCNKVKQIQNLEYDYEITISIGATIAQKNQDYNTLYQIADQALYMVKNKGRNHYKIIV